MESEWITHNNKQRARLEKLVGEITDKELEMVIYKEGWTIAVMLGHLAYWDHWALLLMKKWKKRGVSTSPMMDWDTINDTLFPNDAMLPFLLEIPPRIAANLSVTSAETIDREIEAASPDMIAKIKRLGDETRLFRSIHRKMHLDEIETFLKSKRKKR